jgi:hypothetical protein
VILPLLVFPGLGIRSPEGTIGCSCESQNCSINSWNILNMILFGSQKKDILDTTSYLIYTHFDEVSCMWIRFASNNGQT